MIKSIPTTYDGVRFRSRLEATWAAFFDAVGWKWQYEPLDYEGWTPDFILFGAHGVIPVEVKPIEWGDTSHAMSNYVQKADELSKVRKFVSENDIECLILGAFIAECKGVHSSFCLGVFVEQCIRGTYTDTAFLGIGADEKALDFFSDEQSYHYRMSGENDGGVHIVPPRQSDIRKHWGQASRLTQWKGK